jgi:putative transposase
MATPSYGSLSHSKWDCKYHIAFIPEGRKKELYGKIRGYLGLCSMSLRRKGIAK